jgi:hypothetical protein
MLALILSPVGKIATVLLIIIAAFLGFRWWLAGHDKATLAGIRHDC